MKSNDDTAGSADTIVNVPTEVLNHLAHDLRGSAGVILGALHELEMALGERAVEHEALFAMAKRGVKRIASSANELQRTGHVGSGHVDAS